MRWILTVLALMGLGFSVVGAYVSSNETRANMRKLSAVEAQIEKEEELLQTYRAEWAYLTNPDRLAELVARYQSQLALAPISDAQYGGLNHVPYLALDVQDEAALLTLDSDEYEAILAEILLAEEG